MSNRRIDLAVVRQQISNLLLTYPELVEDDILRADMIEGSTEAFDLLRQCEAKRRKVIELREGLAFLIEQDRARLARFERREEAVRQLMFKLMEAADLRKVELPEATLSVRSGPPKVIIIEEAELPEEYIRVKREPDRAKISAALRSGAVIPGCTFSNGQDTISIRTK